jgi:hypothetical protein
MYIVTMLFAWDPKKNEELKSEGRPAFEETLEAIQRGPLKDEENPVHSGQRLFVVLINSYPHVVPYEVRGDILWLITVYPARKHKP